MKITVYGYYGAGNFGDDMMLYYLVKELKKKHHKLVIDVITVSKEDIHLDDYCRVNIIELTKNNRIENFKKFVSSFRKSQVFIWGGGTCFTDEEGIGDINKFLIAKLMGLKVGYVGVGIGNLKSVKRRVIAKLAFLMCDFITFRDVYSYELAKSISFKKDDNKFYLTEDLAYLWLSSGKDNLSNQNVLKFDSLENMLISLRDVNKYFSEGANDYVVNNICNSVLHLAKKNKIKNIKILDLDDTLDKGINDLLYQKLRNSITPHFNIKVHRHERSSNFFEKIKVIKESDMFFCFRLHGIFAAVFSGTPVIGFSYSPKVNYFLESVFPNEYEDYAINVKKFIATNKELTKKTDELIESKKIREVKCSDEKIENAYRNIEIITDSLNSASNELK